MARSRSRTYAPPSAATARCRANLRAAYRKPPSDVVRDAARCGSIHDVRRAAAGSRSTCVVVVVIIWTSTRWERGHMAHDAVWLRARGLGYVHLEDVWTRALAPALHTVSFCTLDTSARADSDRRVGPGARALSYRTRCCGTHTLLYYSFLFCCFVLRSFFYLPFDFVYLISRDIGLQCSLGIAGDLRL